MRAHHLQDADPRPRGQRQRAQIADESLDARIDHPEVEAGNIQRVLNPVAERAA